MISNCLLGQVEEKRESPLHIAGEGSREASWDQWAAGTECSLKASLGLR